MFLQDKVFIFLAKQQGFGYNNSMEQPTKRQLEILLVLNPFEFNRTYKDVARILGISETCVKSRMARLKKQCPVIYEKFKEVKRKEKLVMRNGLNYSIYQPVIPLSSFDKEHHKTGTSAKMKLCKCGIRIPIDQDSCYICWRREDRKKNPKFYEKDRMFPANGPTPNTIGPIKTYKDINKDFTVDDLPVPQDPLKNPEDFENYDAFLKDFVEGM